jgi:CspA family cold shock protein
MGKYRDHREQRGRRHSNDQETFPDRIWEPSYLQAPRSVTADAVDAEVLWFNAGKGFGFVKLSDGSEAYLHIRVLEAAGGRDLSEGTRLKVTVEEGPRGRRQVVKVLEIGDRIARASRGERQAGDFAAESEGTVKWYNPEKGFGFIAPGNGENDVFVHATALTRSGLSVLEEGQKVVFQFGQGKTGMEVRTIRLA